MTAEVLSGRLLMGLRTLLALLLGLVGIFMVLLAAFAPRTTTVLGVQLFASYALLDGLLAIVAALFQSFKWCCHKASLSECYINNQIIGQKKEKSILPINLSYTRCWRCCARVQSILCSP